MGPISTVSMIGWVSTRERRGTSGCGRDDVGLPRDNQTPGALTSECINPLVDYWKGEVSLGGGVSLGLPSCPCPFWFLFHSASCVPSCGQLCFLLATR